MRHRPLPPLAGLAILVLGGTFVGCTLEDGSLAIDTADIQDALDDREDVDDVEDGPDVVVLPPERVEIYVGDQLMLDVLNEDPEAYILRPSQLPEGSEFESVYEGGVLRWVPQPEDIGENNIVFLHYDIADPTIMLFTRTVVIDVLPRFDLIEYGF